MVQDITLTNNNGFSFTITQNDWECAPDPICMCLVEDKQWNKVANHLQSFVNDVNKDDDEDSTYDFLWAQYEKAVLDLCEVFYYEDLTDEEYNNFISIQDEKEQIKVARQLYKRIKNQ